MSIPTILVVDDEFAVRQLISGVVTSMGYICATAESAEEGLARHAELRPALVLMDVQMQGMSGMEALSQMKAFAPTTNVVIITGSGSINLALRAMQQGAFDYIPKPFAIQDLRAVIERGIAGYHDLNASSFPLQTSVHADVSDEYTLVGSSPAMYEVFKLIGSICATPNHTSVLIQGESGTGKELIARIIHANTGLAALRGNTTSDTAKQATKQDIEPFVGINCTAIPENLLESELFGAERGAYTGAQQRRIGKFEAAGKGTIFLDEIGDLPLTLQSKLLRVIQERAVERVGGNEAIPIEARFIAATHRTLSDEVRAGRFREDLFYRLNVAVVALPPLRERASDVPLLAKYFLSKYNARMNKSIHGFSADALAMLSAYSFPGNVRELENIVERAVMLSSGTMVLPSALGLRDVVISSPIKAISLTPESTTDAASMSAFTPSISELSASEVSEPQLSSTPLSTFLSSLVFSEAREAALAEFEMRFVQELLRRYNGNVSTAASVAQLSRQHFHHLMQKHGVSAQDFRHRA
jgi:DNA-binding NtrC family response regulator